MDAMNEAIATYLMIEVVTRSGIRVDNFMSKITAADTKALKNLDYTLGVMSVADTKIVLTVVEMIFPKIRLMPWAS